MSWRETSPPLKTNWRCVCVCVCGGGGGGGGGGGCSCQFFSRQYMLELNLLQSSRFLSSQASLLLLLLECTDQSTWA